MCKCPSSFWHRDSNSQPLRNESPALTTHALPDGIFVLLMNMNDCGVQLSKVLAKLLAKVFSSQKLEKLVFFQTNPSIFARRIR